MAIKSAINPETGKRKANLESDIVYFLFSFIFLYWILTTYRNELHMDVINIIGTKIKDLLEHNLQIKDFIYQPLFPASTSLCFTFINAKIFHLNTVIEITVGSIFLIILGYKYMKEISVFLLAKRQKILFAFLITFIIFSLHKWEALFTPFFSFAVFFDLSICFFSYFFIVKYISPNFPAKKFHIVMLAFLNLFIILETPAYFFSYVLSILILLFLIRRFKIVEVNKRKWQTILYLNAFLLFVSFSLVIYLSNHPLFRSYTSALSIIDFLKAFFERPIWFIKFYLIANSGPFWGEAYNQLELRVLAGVIILCTYIFAVWYVFRKKDKRLLVPVALIFYNIISYGFITISRYSFNSVEYGSSSRYTAFNLSGVLGLITILFFYILDAKDKIKYGIGWSIMTFILVGCLFVDIRQYKIAPYRTLSFQQIREALLTGENLETLQTNKSASLLAIKVLKKYKLNVYYGYKEKMRGPNFNLAKSGKLVFTPGTFEFDELKKGGFYDYEKDNRFAWTNGKAFLRFDNYIETPDSIVAQLDTYMPAVCSGIIPKVSVIDENKIEYQLTLKKREGDSFIYYFEFAKPIAIQRLNILSDTIVASSDLRVLSFPFKNLEIRR